MSGQDEVLESIAEERQIESTGEKLTIPQREAKAISHLANVLARTKEHLKILGKLTAAEYCEMAETELLR